MSRTINVMFEAYSNPTPGNPKAEKQTSYQIGVVKAYYNNGEELKITEKNYKEITSIIKKDSYKTMLMKYLHIAYSKSGNIDPKEGEFLESLKKNLPEVSIGPGGEVKIEIILNCF